MGMYSILSLKSSTVSTGSEEGTIDSKECKFGLPVAWSALFERTDIKPENICLESPMTQALSNLEKRGVNLSLILGSSWDDGVHEFIAWLNHPEAICVELDLGDWYGERNLPDFEAHLSSLLDTFNEPVYKGKTLLTRKPKINKAWESLCSSDQTGSGIFD